MKEDILTMSLMERQRYHVLEMVVSGKIKLKEA
jgi:hypothetical protein